MLSVSITAEVGVTKKISNTATDNEDTEINTCIFLDYSYLSIKRTPFLSSTFSDYFRFFFQAL